MKQRLRIWQACILMMLTYFVFLLMQYLQDVLSQHFDYMLVSQYFDICMTILACLFPAIVAYFIRYRVIKCPKMFINKSYVKVIKTFCDFISIMINGIIPWCICWLALITSYPYID